MSQRSEKYARRIERRVDRLEEAVDSVKTEQTAQGARIAGIEDDLAVYRAAKAEHSRKAMREKARREQQELERRRARAETALRVGICVVLAAFAMAAALVMAAGAEDACAFVEKTDAADLLGVYALQAEQAPDAMEQERYKGYSEQNGAPARAQRKRVLWGEEERRNGRAFREKGSERYEGRSDEALVEQGYLSDALPIAFPAAGTPLSDFAEGAIVKLNENGSPVEFYVAKHNYESGLNGTGRTLLVRKECYGTCLFGDGNNSYIGGILDSSLNGAYKSKLDASIQNAIGATYIRCGDGGSSDGTTIAKRAVFQLSASEFGSGPGYNDGTSLPIAAVLKKATYNGNASALSGPSAPGYKWASPSCPSPGA